MCSILNEEFFEQFQARIISKQNRKKFVSTFRWQGIKAKLCVVGFASPPMLVLGAVVNQQEELGCGEAFDETIE